MGLKLENNPNWRGGRTITSHGYVMVKADPKKYSTMPSGYIYEHKLVMEDVLGRKLKKHEKIHHVNHNKRDNSPNNLLLCGHRLHKYLHRKEGSELRKPGEKNTSISCACGCGKVFQKYDKHGRPREYCCGCGPTKGKGKKNAIELIFCKCGCKTEINKYDKYGRERKYVSGHNWRQSFEKRGLCKKLA